MVSGPIIKWVPCLYTKKTKTSLKHGLELVGLWDASIYYRGQLESKRSNHQPG